MNRAPRPKRRSNLLLYLALNVLVSAATTLGVLFLWDSLRRAEIPPSPQGAPAAAVAGQEAAAKEAGGQEAAGQEAGAKEAAGQAATQPPAAQKPAATPEPSPSPLPPDAVVLSIQAVVGAGDVQQEFVRLQRQGEGNLLMAGWTLEGQRGQRYAFPESPALTLYQGGAVQVYTKTGDDTVNEVYWDRTEAAWQAGEVVRVVDAQGMERARYTIP